MEKNSKILSKAKNQCGKVDSQAGVTVQVDAQDKIIFVHTFDKIKTYFLIGESYNRKKIHNEKKQIISLHRQRRVREWASLKISR